jgi:hypothetical protein
MDPLLASVRKMLYGSERQKTHKYVGFEGRASATGKSPGAGHDATTDPNEPKAAPASAKVAPITSSIFVM